MLIKIYNMKCLSSKFSLMLMCYFAVLHSYMKEYFLLHNSKHEFQFEMSSFERVFSVPRVFRSLVCSLWMKFSMFFTTVIFINFRSFSRSCLLCVVYVVWSCWHYHKIYVWLKDFFSLTTHIRVEREWMWTELKKHI